MLKKIGLLFVLIVLSFAILAQTPPTDQDGEVVFDPRPEGTGVVYFGVINGEPFNSPTLPEGLEPITLPDGSVLPEEVDDGDYTMDISEDDFYCVVAGLEPELEPGPIVTGGGSIACAGSWDETWLRATLQRHWIGPWWTNLDSASVGWAEFPLGILIDSLWYSCNGEYTYRSVADGKARDNDGNVHTSTVVSLHERYDCD